ncbi:MAG: NAD(P)/FAD-dependent oxidoreductase, partial [Lautropia sp.]
RNGWLQVGYSEQAVAAMHARAAHRAARGAPADPLDRAEVARRLGTPAYAGGWLDRRAGAIQPLAYAHGLAAALQRAGGRLHGATQITSLDRHGRRWRGQTPSGAQIDAEQVVIATNGYTGALWPGLAQTVLAANSFIVATEPLAGDAARTILPGGETASTSQRLLLYFRRDTAGRLLLGGRGRFAEPSAPSDFGHLERALALLYPQLGPLRIDYRWAGRIAVTLDAMPHVHQPAPGVLIALGYNGRGVALATSVGYHLAQRLLRADAPLPFPASPIAPIPLHRLQRLYIAAGVAWYSVLDRVVRR